MYTFAIMRIICTIFVKQQTDGARDREVGYNKDKLVYYFMTGEIPKKCLIEKMKMANP